MISVFGIRHHGPGSAKTLNKALQELQPDCILIEGPQDAEGLIDYVQDAALQPPVAMLIYNAKNLKQAAYFPFAVFSPEWQAARYGLENGLPVRFMDLPMSVNFALNEEKAKAIQLQAQLDTVEEDWQPLLKDPLGYLANLAGYKDRERWWEVTFENAENDTTIFEKIVGMMALLREETKGQESGETLLREAFMRKTIRQAVKDGFQNIAIICGAWHAPVLQKYLTFKQSADNALLKGLKKNKTKATWIPWTYQRLAFQSGYRAGVLSPAWYDLLFNHQEEVNTRWMIAAARLLRKEDLDASAAHATEAVRLAEHLAIIRNLNVAGIEELEAAATAVLCEGRTEKLNLIRNKLIIGQVMGEVPDHIPQIPLQQDLEKMIKTARLSKERKSLVPTERKLDLRKETNLIASHLLHRLRLLNIKWGKEKAVSENNTGGFTEIWTLCWEPEFEIQTIEAGMYGNTVEAAATNYAIHQSEELVKLNELTTLAGKVLKADLPIVIEKLIIRLQQVAALSRDTFHLMEALLPLAQIVRYGSSRKMDIDALADLVDQLIPRIAIGLPGATVQIEEELAIEFFDKLLACNRAISLLDKAEHQSVWHNALKVLSQKQSIHPLIQGASTRILLDKSSIDIKATSRAMSFALSAGNPVFQAAQWLEGFLHGSGLLLIYNPALWNIVDQWVSALSEEVFLETVPILRRTFSRFSEPERKKMLDLVQNGFSEISTESAELTFDQERVDLVLPTLKTLLNL